MNSHKHIDYENFYKMDQSNKEREVFYLPTCEKTLMRTAMKKIPALSNKASNKCPSLMKNGWISSEKSAKLTAIKMAVFKFFTTRKRVSSQIPNITVCPIFCKSSSGDKLYTSKKRNVGEVVKWIVNSPRLIKPCKSKVNRKANIISDHIKKISIRKSSPLSSVCSL